MIGNPPYVLPRPAPDFAFGAHPTGFVERRPATRVLDA